LSRDVGLLWGRGDEASEESKEDELHDGYSVKCEVVMVLGVTQEIFILRFD
jgi:hypothetical protein